MNGINQSHTEYYPSKYNPILTKTISILQKSAITIGLIVGSMVTTVIGYLLLGCLVGRIPQISTYEHEYACACDELP